VVLFTTSIWASTDVVVPIHFIVFSKALHWFLSLTNVMFKVSLVNIDSKPDDKDLSESTIKTIFLLVKNKIHILYTCYRLYLTFYLKHCYIQTFSKKSLKKLKYIRNNLIYQFILLSKTKASKEHQKRIFSF